MPDKQRFASSAPNASSGLRAGQKTFHEPPPRGLRPRPRGEGGREAGWRGAIWGSWPQSACKACRLKLPMNLPEGHPGEKVVTAEGRDRMRGSLPRFIVQCGSQAIENLSP